MATTGRSSVDSGARCASIAPARRADTRRAVALAVATTAFAAPLLAPAPAHAQRWVFGGGISSQLTWSSNADLGSTGGGDDTILNVRPHVTLRTVGGPVQLDGSAALNGVTTANHTQPSRILPEADFNARAEAIQRFLYLEGGVRAVQSSVDPFGPRPEQGTSLNTFTAWQLRFTPRIESQIDPLTRYRLQSANSWARQSGGGDSVTGATSGEGYFGRHTALVEHDPRPLGWRLEAERSQTRYRNDLQEPVTNDLVRATVDYAVGSDWTLGVHAGRERTSLLPDDPQHTIFGAQARWQPSPRTTLSAFEEKRFFGKSYRLIFDNRLPHVAWNVTLSRDLDTTPQALFDLRGANDLADSLDAILTSRYPDPIERARIVQDIIARQGLPSQSLQPLSLFSQRVSIVTGRNASVTFLGARNTLTLNAFGSRTQDASQAAAPATGTTFGNNSQYGASASLSHVLTPATSVNVSTAWSRITAIGTDEQSIERSVRLRVGMQTGPRTNVFGGARYRRFTSNATSSVTAEGNEGAVFVGLDHAF